MSPDNRSDPHPLFGEPFLNGETVHESVMITNKIWNYTALERGLICPGIFVLTMGVLINAAPHRLPWVRYNFT